MRDILSYLVTKDNISKEIYDTTVPIYLEKKYFCPIVEMVADVSGIFYLDLEGRLICPGIYESVGTLFI